MKVLFVTYPMAFHTPGGGEIQLLAYKKALEKKGVQVDLFNPWEPNFQEYDIVHYFSCVGGSVHFCNFIKSLNIPLVISSSLWITEDTKHFYPIGEIRDQLNTADFVITNSQIESETLAKVLDIELDKFKHVYNGVDDIFFESVEENLFRSEFNIDTAFILNVANVEPRKNQHALAKAMKKFPHLKLVLIGHVRDEQYFQELLSLAGDQLVYIGPVDHESNVLRSAYAAAELFVLPSTLETPGLAALEAGAVGCPIIITKEGSTKEYFGDYALYIDPESIDEIVLTINQVSTSRKKIKKMTDFSWNSVINRLITVYTQCSINPTKGSE